MNAVEPPNGVTPILDRLKPFPAQVKPSGSRRTLTFVAAMACGVLLGLILANPAISGGMNEWLAREELTPIGVAVSLIVALFAGIAIHEAGHAIVGSLVGFRVSAIRVSRLQLDLPFRFSVYRGSGTGAGGWVTVLPVKRDNLALRAVLMLAAGPAANLLAAAALSVLPFSTSAGVRMFILVSIGLGTINLIPFRSRVLLSDGRRILMLLRNRARGERWLAIMKLVADLADGTPAESLSSEYLALAIAVEDNTSDTVTAHALAYSSAFHRRNDEEAARMLETALRYSGYAAPIVREALMTDAAVFQGRRRRRVDLAEAWRASLPEKTEVPWLHALASAGVLEARGDVASALSALDRAREKIRAEPNQIRRDLSLRSLERWQGDLKAIGSPEARTLGRSGGSKFRGPESAIS